MNIFQRYTLIQRFNRRDPAAVKKIYDLCASRIVPFITKLVHDREESKDILVESFLRLFTSNEEFRTVDNLKAYVFTIAVNLARDYLRNEKKKHRNEDELAEQSEHATQIDIESAKEYARFIELIYSEIRKLPEKCRQVCILYFKEGLSDAEIAERLGLSQKTVANQKSIAIKKLRIPLLKIDRSSLHLVIVLCGSAAMVRYL